MSRAVQYVEVIDVKDGTTTVKVTGTDDSDHDTTLDLSTATTGLRLVSDSERKLSRVCANEFIRGRLMGADLLNYVLQTGQGANIIALSPMELLQQQDALVAACRKRRTGIPAAVIASLSVPYEPDDIVPLIRPDTLQLVHVRRQHVLDFSTASRTNRPGDIYTDDAPVTSEATPGPARRSDRVHHVASLKAPPKFTASSSALELQQPDDDQCSSSSEDQDVREVQHLHIPLAKRRQELGTKTWRYADLISALSAHHKFAKYFYNSKTADFMSTAKDFVIYYSDQARPDPAMARLLTFWINNKFSLFRNTLLSNGLPAALNMSTKFTHRDDNLAALRDSSQQWKQAPSTRFWSTPTQRSYW
ncbi:hypothetical protein ON010_g17398 [Phytophthora cinnamomi]|nr:hypothetical protein ON010_g17398 [Phytophthora cinnamomi]